MGDDGRDGGDVERGARLWEALTAIGQVLLTEMGRFIWITQRNHSSLQIQAARLAHIPL